MFKNYLKVAVRNLLKHPLFTVINLLCLAMGITFSLVIGVFAMNQFHINASLKNVQRQYIIKSHWKEKDMGLEITTFGPLAKTLKSEYPDLVSNYYRYNPVTNVVSAEDKHFKEDIAIGDTAFISMYGFPLLYGDRNHPFTDNSSAVITETMAMKLFGQKNAVGKTISLLTTHGGEKQHYTVSAVLKDIPYNSVTHLLGSGYNVFVPTVGSRYYLGGDPAEGWSSAYEIGMIELKPGITTADLERPLRQVLVKYTAPDIARNLRMELAPVSDYYLKDNNGAAYKMMMALAIAAVFILLMAVINFVNINIGAAAYRLKEIGLRKVFGGKKRQLMLQFIAEAMVLAMAASVVSLVAYELLRPVSDDILNTKFQSVVDFNIGTLGYLLSLTVFTGFAAGSYPAFILSTSKVINAVRGKMAIPKGSILVRKTMVTIQFTLAIIVFICALTVSGQIDYIFNKDIGYDKEQLLVITAFPKQWDSVGASKMIRIRDVFSQAPSVKDASLSFEIPDRKPPGSLMMQPVVNGGAGILVASCGVDEHYASTFQLKILRGSCFSQTGTFVPNQVVLNESAVKALGLTVASAVNTQIRSGTAGTPGTMLTVAGVVGDFNYSSLQEPIGPVAFFHVRDATAYRYLSLKLKGGDITGIVERIKNKWKELSPGAPFEYTFMDDKFESLYKSELQLKNAARLATVLNLIIVLLGVFGVVTFTLIKRTREIAVRRVLGASIGNLILLFVRDYAWIMLIASAIAWPLTYLATYHWLQGYAYRIHPGISPYLTVSAGVFLASLAIIAIQSTKAALANPVKSLRTE